MDSKYNIDNSSELLSLTGEDWMEFQDAMSSLEQVMSVHQALRK
jgi:hypothetical protein